MSQETPKHIHFKNAGGVAVVGFSTPYLQTEDTIAKAGEELFELVDAEGYKKLIVSFSGVRFVSSSMLAQLVKLQKKATTAKGKLRLCCLTPALEEVLHTSHLDKLFEVFPDEKSAIDKF